MWQTESQISCKENSIELYTRPLHLRSWELKLGEWYGTSEKAVILESLHNLVLTLDEILLNL